MSWKRKVRVGSFAAGVLLLVVMLLGARLLSPGSGGGSDPAPKTAAPAQNGTGPIVTGYVYSSPPMVGYLLPTILPSGRVTKVHVSEDSHVKAGDPLYEFDATNLEAERRVAEANVKVAEAKVNSARAAADTHQTQIDLQKQVIENAKLKVTTTRESLRATEENAKKLARLGRSTATEQEIADEVNLNPDVVRLRIALQTAEREVEVEKVRLTGLQKADVQAQVAEAEALVNLAKSTLQAKEDAVKQCVVRAEVDGTVERVTVGPGATIGISTRTPAVEIIPDGPRIVRGEVEPEFTDRLPANLEGKTVTIYDHTNPNYTYKGVVRKVGGSFLPRRTASDALIPSDTRVLEVRIEVTDPAPGGKTPPLRVGQKVKVNLGQ